MQTGQRSKIAVLAFARCSVGLAGLGGFVLAWSLWAALQIVALRVPDPAEALPWAALITSVPVLVVASAAAIWRPVVAPGARGVLWRSAFVDARLTVLADLAQRLLLAMATDRDDDRLGLPEKRGYRGPRAKPGGRPKTDEVVVHGATSRPSPWPLSGPPRRDIVDIWRGREGGCSAKACAEPPTPGWQRCWPVRGEPSAAGRAERRRTGRPLWERKGTPCVPGSRRHGMSAAFGLCLLAGPAGSGDISASPRRL